MREAFIIIKDMEKGRLLVKMEMCMTVNIKMINQFLHNDLYMGSLIFPNLNFFFSIIPNSQNVPFRT
jgi:hypothetical protein